VLKLPLAAEKRLMPAERNMDAKRQRKMLENHTAEKHIIAVLKHI
jgi:hypothetical protein